MTQKYEPKLYISPIERMDLNDATEKFIQNILLAQPHLKRGDNFTEPSNRFVNGKIDERGDIVYAKTRAVGTKDKIFCSEEQAKEQYKTLIDMLDHEYNYFHLHSSHFVLTVDPFEYNNNPPPYQQTENLMVRVGFSK